MGILCLYFVTESCMDCFRVIYGLVSFSSKGVEQKRNVLVSAVYPPSEYETQRPAEHSGLLPIPPQLRYLLYLENGDSSARRNREKRVISCMLISVISRFCLWLMRLFTTFDLQERNRSWCAWQNRPLSNCTRQKEQSGDLEYKFAFYERKRKMFVETSTSFLLSKLTYYLALQP